MRDLDKTINVLSVTSEAVPLVKTGGLADVAGALPSALSIHGIDYKTLLPAYPGLKESLTDASVVMQIDELFGGSAQVIAGKVDDIVFLLLDASHLYERDGGIYGQKPGMDWQDNGERFAALCIVATEIAASGISLAEGSNQSWQPHIVHAHDWQAGLAPAYIRYRNLPVKTVLTIHNIAFQGLIPSHKLSTLALPNEEFHVDGFEFFGHISTMKAGLNTADVITTVSPTYAKELCTSYFGMGLEGVISNRKQDLIGIINGIDLDIWNPAKDNLIDTNYDLKNLEKKSDNKNALLAEFNLPLSDGPVAAVVSRLTAQKGLDLLIDALPVFFESGGSLILLGSGDAEIENAYEKLAQKYASQMAVMIGYDESLSHRIFAGADSILIPSRFEPCGLTQLYGLRYGTIPLVSRTGGLADTVIDANKAAIDAGVATGIIIDKVELTSLQNGLLELCHLYQDRSVWQQLQKNAMSADIGWDKRSKEYAKLYHDLIG